MFCVDFPEKKIFHGYVKVSRKPLLNPVWNDLFDNGDVGNFVMVAENKEIRVNKKVLEMFSPVFAAMLK